MKLKRVVNVNICCICKFTFIAGSYLKNICKRLQLSCLDSIFHRINLIVTLKIGCRKVNNPFPNLDF